MIRILFVCTGNICRSPAAEGALRALVDARGLSGRIEIESAGTGSWHVGEPPDSRMRHAAAERGIDLDAQRARQVRGGDFARFDHIVAMDRSHMDSLTRLCPQDESHRLRLFLEGLPTAPGLDVPDPYYGGDDGFEEVLDLVEAGAAALLADIETELG